MGWNNPEIPWSELERRLSDRRRPDGRGGGGASLIPGSAGNAGLVADGGDSPAWSRKRHPYRPPSAGLETQAGPVVPYAELHAHSAFSFLDGASTPEQLVEEAHRLGLSGLAITDHDGFYGIVRFAEAAEAFPDLSTVFGAELSLGLSAPQMGAADPEGDHVLVLARREEGYHRLAAAITAGQLAGGEKGRPVYDLEDLAARAGGEWVVPTGCRKGTVRRALATGGPDAAWRELDRLVALFGHDQVVVELFDHGHPGDQPANDELAALAERAGLRCIATNAVHYATPPEHRLAQALAAVRARRSLDELDGWLPATDGLHLRSGAEMAERFARYPGAVAHTVTIAEQLGFTLRSARPRLPRQQVPEGHTPMSWLRELVWRGADELYPGVPDDVRERLQQELDVIEQKDFPGYFLIVYDLVREARSRGILCQGRGSAANSAVCYVLRITAVDSIYYRLPFERFLSALRDEEPDIDVDFDSDRREEIIQYVYAKYGRQNAAQVANVISYRPKVAVRDMAKALGYSTGQQDAWSRQVERWGSVVETDDHDIPDAVIELAEQVLTFPRHLGIHSGGMVLTDRPVGEVVPIEHARMENRTVLQWDKDDCAWMGLVKFDLLGLGMLAAMQYTFDLIRDTTGEEWELATIPKEEAAVYDMLCRADSIGVFQVESRAQMGTLPRLKPRRFYDLVVEIALIRPGPVQGGAVHPYIRRRTGEEPVTYLHPKLVPVLERTLGVPLFQEQLMQMAVAVGNCSAADADLLRRAMGSKRGVERIESLKERLYAGMAENGIDDETADTIYAKIQAFANFGFAESHSLSFGLLVYASSWLKLHYPAAFLAALLRAQPMGFYSPQTLTADARRHGVEVRRPDIQLSGVDAGLEPVDASRADASGEASAYRSRLPGPTGFAGCTDRVQPAVPDFERDAPDRSAEHRRDGAYAVRLGLADVSSIGTALAERIVAERDRGGPFRDMPDVARRVGLETAELEALSAAGAFASFGLDRRRALWLAGEAAQDRPEYLPGSVVVVQPPLLPLLTDTEQVVYDLWATGISPDDHPIRHIRDRLDARGVIRVDRLRETESGRRIEVGGVVTHRQRPATASGITFLNVEDESGTVNIIASVGVWNRYRRVAREAPAMIVRGVLERSRDGVVNVVADRFESLTVSAPHRSRDFR
ncbi:error-prone DNA polymerase [Agromyces aerolatus]|uniref:error-prone DNA polymerase n=1 Tax=Agromyces sp. LY-1074 TaxID=3074080 RepID=UPI002859F820|nr:MULTISPECIES: error-prone DNA polymerase [unclassified Agromyces]MDR5700082.1 error-prone DNA polymerase [Agromyces sp. LY-1074]MDR5706550.1 error-prone DNA polymerase [Agromyces sp. LY-1358]